MFKPRTQQSKSLTGLYVDLPTPNNIFILANKGGRVSRNGAGTLKFQAGAYKCYFYIVK